MSAYEYNEIPELQSYYLDRLWFGIDKLPGEGCWLWSRCKTKAGYGVLRVKIAPRKYRNIYVHRLVFKIVTGVDPAGNNLCHHCDNPPCCNPKHLFLGTQMENIKDMMAKGRGRNHDGLAAAIPKWKEMRLSRNRDAVGSHDVQLIREMWASRLFLREFIIINFTLTRNLFENVIHRDDWPGVPMLPMEARITRPNRRRKNC